MYLWKCWRDTRHFFLFFLLVSALAAPTAGLVGMRSGLVEEFGKMAVQSTRIFILLAVALGLGTIGAIQEFTDKTAHFLFTKPRSRAYFVWTSWAVGWFELLAIALVNLLAGWLTIAHYGKSPLRSVMLGSIKMENVVGIILYTLFIYCLTYSLTVVLRNGLKGLGASLGSLTLLNGSAIAVRVQWNVMLPLPPQRIGSLPLVISDVIWLLVALLFVLAAQVAVERAEL